MQHPNPKLITVISSFTEGNLQKCGKQEELDIDVFNSLAIKSIGFKFNALEQSNSLLKIPVNGLLFSALQHPKNFS
jgi:hypothetical protein